MKYQIKRRLMRWAVEQMVERLNRVPFLGWHDLQDIGVERVFTDEETGEVCVVFEGVEKRPGG